MHGDKSNTSTTTNQVKQLDAILSEIITALENNREKIFNIANQSKLRVQYLEENLKQKALKINKVNQKLDKLQKNIIPANQKNMESAQLSFSDQDNGTQVDKALQYNDRQLHNLQQIKAQLEDQRAELLGQLTSCRDIWLRAETLLDITGIALRIMESDGNNQQSWNTTQNAINDKQWTLKVLQAQESERSRIARELHDGPAQTAAGMLMKLNIMEHWADPDYNLIIKELSQLKNLTRENLEEIRRIIFDLRPAQLKGEPLYYALANYFDYLITRYNFITEYRWSGEKRKYANDTEKALFRLVQEAITNARKHAGVNHAAVAVEDTGQNLNIIIKDEGVGFDIKGLNNSQDHYGIAGMHERVKYLGGTMEINSSPGRGTQINITVPLEGEA